MHSKIIQVSSKPISEDEYKTSEDFYESHEPWADYIGDEVTDEQERHDCIKHVANLLDGVFKLNCDDTLTYLGDDALRKFLNEWADELRRMAGQLTADNILRDQNLWKVRHCCTDTHKGTAYRFYIEEWNGWAGPFEDMIDFASSQLKKGDRIYIGAVIDYHY